MARTKISAHVSERLVNRLANRFIQLDNANTNNDQASIDRQTDILKNTLWVLDAVGFDKQVIDSVVSDALDEAGLKQNPLEQGPKGPNKGGKGSGSTGATGVTGATGPTDSADAPVS